MNKGQDSYLGKYFGSDKVNNLQGLNIRKVNLLGKRNHNRQGKYLKRVKEAARNRKMYDDKNTVLSMVSDHWEEKIRTG